MAPFVEPQHQQREATNAIAFDYYAGGQFSFLMICVDKREIFAFLRVVFGTQEADS